MKKKDLGVFINVKFCVICSYKDLVLIPILFIYHSSDVGKRDIVCKLPSIAFGSEWMLL